MCKTCENSVRHKRLLRARVVLVDPRNCRVAKALPFARRSWLKLGTGNWKLEAENWKLLKRQSSQKNLTHRRVFQQGED